jgi:hypothetical protein
MPIRNRAGKASEEDSFHYGRFNALLIQALSGQICTNVEILEIRSQGMRLFSCKESHAFGA